MAMACESREFEERAEIASRFANTAASVSSLTRILEQALQHQQIILHDRHLLEPLLEKVRLLQYSLENSSPKNSKKIISLEVKVINLKNLIENRIREQVKFYMTLPTYNLTFPSSLLKKVKRKLYFIKQLLMEIEEESGVQDQQPGAAASVSSLTRILEQALQHQQIILHDRHLVEPLLEKVRLLQYSLENSSPKNSKKIISLEVKVINLKNLIENRIQEKIIFYEPLPSYNLTFSSSLLKKVKRKLDFIKQLLMEIEEESGVQDQQPGAGSPEPAAAPSDNITMVGLDDDFKEVKLLLLSNSKKLNIVSLVGMGGIGKTTLGRAIYNDSSISRRFDVRAWVTVSQSFDVRQTIITLLDSMENHGDKMLSSSIDQLKERLYKSLKGRRYLIVLDDLWDTNVWENLRRLFPNDENESRILLTTRFKNVAIYVNSSTPIQVHFLNEVASWKLFRDKVFGKDRCPPELEEIGKRIVRNCQGLPLAIVVISGLLSKATRTQHYWKNVAEHLSSVIIANDEQCMKTLSLSYSALPHHLKRCFLYMAIFPEDYVIHVSTLVSFWVGAGLLKLEKSESFEDAAYEYFLDLVDRSLILVDKQSSIGKIKTCKIHDLIRDFCTREGEKDMLFSITDQNLYGIPMGADLPCLCIRKNTTNIFPCDEKKLSSLTVRSLVCFDERFCFSLKHLNSRQLKVMYLFSIPYFDFNRDNYPWSSSECRYPVLQSLTLDYIRYIHGSRVSMWNMPKLRHVQGRELFVPDPLEGGNSITVLVNLQTLSTVDIRCSKEVLERIPNLKKFGLCSIRQNGQHQLNNLVHLHKLEVLKLQFKINWYPGATDVPLEKFTLPPSLKKITLQHCRLTQENMVIFGSLPNLEVLKLKCNFIDQEWEPTEGEFLELKYLHLQTNLKHWIANSTHYPKLQRLIIRECDNLEEIPCGFGEIPTLELIELCRPTPSLMVSAQKIQEEQLELGNDDFKLKMAD